ILVKQLGLIDRNRVSNQIIQMALYSLGVFPRHFKPAHGYRKQKVQAGRRLGNQDIQMIWHQFKNPSQVGNNQLVWRVVWNVHYSSFPSSLPLLTIYSSTVEGEILTGSIAYVGLVSCPIPATCVYGTDMRQRFLVGIKKECSVFGREGLFADGA